MDLQKTKAVKYWPKPSLLAFTSSSSAVSTVLWLFARANKSSSQFVLPNPAFPFTVKVGVIFDTMQKHSTIPLTNTL